MFVGMLRARVFVWLVVCMYVCVSMSECLYVFCVGDVCVGTTAALYKGPVFMPL